MPGPVAKLIKSQMVSPDEGAMTSCLLTVHDDVEVSPSFETEAMWCITLLVDVDALALRMCACARFRVAGRVQDSH